MLSPPMSQDQFALVCPEWSKTAEKDNRPLVGAGIRATAAAINERMDHTIAPWLVAGRDPTREDVTLFLKVVSALLASQTVQTQRRTRLAAAQENAVIDRLQRAEWTRLPSRLIDHRAQVPARHFMYKTRFATSPTTHQEVDIACGLPGTYVVAMECKVTNDETNSVKRVNDVLKKATAWRRQWGAFVQTAALLQGVIAPKDVQRLTDAEVEVFWSHDLDTFMAWLAARA
ncbi:XamI family restriction endonuclease [Methylobacterium fujisawaense]